MTEPLGEKRVDPGGVRGGVVLVVAFATLAVMALGVLLAWELQKTASTRPSSAHAGRFGSALDEKSGIEMSLFPRQHPGTSARIQRVPATHERALVAGTSPHGEPDRAASSDGSSQGSSADRSHEHASRRLQSYGWADRARGRVHIPIARAMDLVVEREARDGAVP